jgi:hypothetical protein
MYGCFSGIILVNPACTRSWLAITASRTVIRMKSPSSSLRLRKIACESVTIQPAVRSCWEDASDCPARVFGSLAMDWILDGSVMGYWMTSAAVSRTPTPLSPAATRPPGTSTSAE